MKEQDLGYSKEQREFLSLLKQGVVAANAMHLAVQQLGRDLEGIGAAITLEGWDG